MCLTKVPENRMPFPKPDHYDPMEYELLACSTADALDRAVNELLAEGWKLYGDPVVAVGVSANGYVTTKYAQALTREVEDGGGA